jgi:ABC-type multidrug transport system fused ATPase/permease subunit
MITYAAIGVALAILISLSGAIFALFTQAASKTLYTCAMTRVMHAPMSFFETTPLGRIMTRFAKDVDTLDSALPDALRNCVNILANILGAIFLIGVLLPWFIVPLVFICGLYHLCGAYSQSSTRELKVSDIFGLMPAMSHVVFSAWKGFCGPSWMLTSRSLYLGHLPSAHMARLDTMRKSTMPVSIE